tara:strand:+ start:958 stop:1143 length:186 start_codon:yes stop_codon:yes gene_type:complete
MWLLIIYFEETKDTILKMLYIDSIKDLGYILGLKSTTVSNCYHKLIKPRGPLKFCNILQIV